MGRIAFALFTLVVASAAFAEPPEVEQLPASTAPKATATATSASLMGTACSYTTGIMAERVQAEGESFRYHGSMTRRNDTPQKGVAVPFSIDDPTLTFVIANEFVEQIVVNGHEKEKLELKGKVLEVQGTRFFLLERYGDPSPK